tara:strand:- start:1416 stop:1979 length:564 start_codon:yes stop_codon:yes gene_type:complete
MEIKSKEKKKEEFIKEDSRTENVLTNLKIISSLKPNEKLTKNGSIFIIDPPTYVQGAYRWWNNDSRIDSMNHIESMIELSFSLIDDIFTSEVEMSTGSTNDNNYYHKRIMPQTYFQNENSARLQNFSIELTNSIKGLQNLKLTYHSDISVCSKIDVLIDKINIRLSKIAKLLTIDSQHTMNSLPSKK